LDVTECPEKKNGTLWVDKKTAFHFIKHLFSFMKAFSFKFDIIKVISKHCVHGIGI